MSEELIIGASGQIGGVLLLSVPAGSGGATGTCRSCSVPGLVKLDIRDSAAVESLIHTEQPSTVYLTAALGNADYCEDNPSEGYATNVRGTQNVVLSANRTKALVVYFSSDYIFDGLSGPYREIDLPNPLCEYGRQKLMAEHCIVTLAKAFLIIRTTVVYGWERQHKNFVYRLLDTLRDGKTLRVPADQVGTPTYAPDLAKAVRDLVASGVRGVFHVVGPLRTSRYQFAQEAARVFGLDESLLQPVTTTGLDQTAPRPLNAGMSAEKAESALGRKLLDYREGLRVMAAESDVFL